jgi:hypothetical protein
MAADASLGLFDLVRQSQLAPPDSGPPETHEGYIHGED